MKAIVYRTYGSPDVLEFTTLAEPTPKPDEVLIRVVASSINQGDWHLLHGEPLLVRPSAGLWRPKHPILGADVAGVVVAVGRAVTRFEPGDAVFGDLSASSRGGFAEYVAAPEDALALKPAAVPFADAAATPTAGVTAWRALVTEGRVKPGDTVLVQGTGGVSLFALQFAKLLGAYVIVTSSSDAKLERAQALGADAVINYRETPGWGKRTREIVPGGVDHIVEVGGQGTLPESLRAIRPGGTISMIGVLAGGTMDARLGLVVTRHVRMQGVTVGSREDFVAMARAMDLAKLHPVVDRTFAFEELPQALDHLASGQHFGKICIRH